MKVAFKFYAFPSVSETFIVSNIIAAIDSGVDANLIVNQINSIEKSSQKDLIQQYDLLKRTYQFDQPANQYVRWTSFLKRLFNPVYAGYFVRMCILKRKLTLAHMFHLGFYRQFRDVDVFHVHFSINVEPLLALKAIGYIKSKIVVTFHGFDAHDMFVNRNKSRLLSRYNEYVDHITVNSGYLKEVLIDQGFRADQLDIVPIGIDTTAFSTTGPISHQSAPFKLISVGRLIPLKGHHLGIQVLANLLDKGLDVTYTIIGNGAQMQSLKDQVNTLGIQERVFFKGELSQKKIQELLPQHHCFLMTSVFDGERREAYGVVSVEAQSMGLPVIAFDSGGVSSTLDANRSGILVDEGDTSAMTEAVSRLIEEPVLFNKMSTEAQNFARTQRDLKQTVAKYLECYKS